MFKVYHPSDHLLTALQDRMGGTFDKDKFQNLPGGNGPSLGGDKKVKHKADPHSFGLDAHPIGVPYNVSYERPVVASTTASTTASFSVTTQPNYQAGGSSSSSAGPGASSGSFRTTTNV